MPASFQIASLVLGLAASFAPAVWAAETARVDNFGANPGNLLMFEYVPEGVPTGSPLVVALHGCTQSAETFDDESGWTELAERLGFAVLLPQQQESNNRDRCFNFFLEDDNRRGRGEAASIMTMIEAAKARHGSDPVFITGLSAGGAMSAVMLAAYPEAFRAGAIIAGVPYGCASTGGSPVLEIQKYWTVLTNPFGEAAWAAYRCGIDRTGFLQFAPASRKQEEWRRLLLEAEGGKPAQWPQVSLWQGSEDRTVHRRNVDELTKQWTAAHGLDRKPDGEETVPAFRRREHKDSVGQTRVEVVEVEGLGHAVPVDPGSAPGQCGRVVPPYFVDRDICAAAAIASFWGLAQ